MTSDLRLGLLSRWRRTLHPKSVYMRWPCPSLLHLSRLNTQPRKKKKKLQPPNRRPREERWRSASPGKRSRGSGGGRRRSAASLPRRRPREPKPRRLRSDPCSPAADQLYFSIIYLFKVRSCRWSPCQLNKTTKALLSHFSCYDHETSHFDF